MSVSAKIERTIESEKTRGAGVRVTNGRNFSYPGYQELLAGWPDSGITSNDTIPNRNVTVLEWLNRQPGLAGHVAASASWNAFPLKVGEMTLGDYLRPLGLDTVLVGKTHMEPDLEGMERLGIDPDSIIGVRVSECGFDPYERDDGLHGLGPDGRYDPRLPRYNDYLNAKGYGGENPWHDFANSAEGDGNRIASGWAMRHARKPARCCL